MKISTIAIAGSFAGLLVSFWNRNDLPHDIEFHPASLAEPRQTATRKPPFEVVYGDVAYRVEPEYAYELSGLVVSYRHHDGNSRMHRFARDHLNMLDLCVVWGDSATRPTLSRIKFWNGIFTCNASTRDGEAWEAFSLFELSNNHLISANDSIRRQVRDVAIGDQVRVRGYLANYSSDKGGKRGTSTTRTDTGDGACETLFVEQFEILKQASSYWRISMWVSLAILVSGLLLHFRRPYRPY